uniref:Uncharacterized protein n=1 Tax=Arundo donax TaxID=35708 RepID=A0A0A9EU63_ARUDO
MASSSSLLAGSRPVVSLFEEGFLPASDFRGLLLFVPFSGSSLPSSPASSAAGTGGTASAFPPATPPPPPPPSTPPQQPPAGLTSPHDSFDCTHRLSRFASADECEGFTGDGVDASGSADPPMGTRNEWEIAGDQS